MRYSSIFVALLVAGCGADVDVCEQAANHREECLGEYVTPPACDADGEAKARQLLTLDCTQLAQLNANGKADGAFCDWFGLGCTSDEPIFEGKSCKHDADCVSGSSCIENHCFEGIASDQFSAIMEKFTGTPETDGSATTLMAKNSDVKNLRLALIAKAQHSIHMTAFLVEKGDDTKEEGRALIEAIGRGVEVRLIVDAQTQYTNDGYGVLDDLKHAGAMILPFNPVVEWLGVRPELGINPNQRVHEKMFIVDGTDVLMGGRNIGSDYWVDGEYRDSDVYLSGPGVKAVQDIFTAEWDQFGQWERLAGCPNQSIYGFYCPPEGETLSGNLAYTPEVEPIGAAKTRAIYNNPRAQKTSYGYLTTLNAVRSARKSIVLANAYFVPPMRLRKHLKAAVARGVKVTILTNSRESTDQWWMYYAAINFYKELITAGVVIHEYNGKKLMHAKTFLIDDELAIVGSYNLDPRSAGSNSETMLIVRDGDVVSELRDAMVTDLQNTTVASANIPLADLVKARAMRIAEPFM